MRLGDIKIASLKLMHADNEGITMNIDSIPNLEQGEYKAELNSMRESINRCFDRLLMEGVLDNRSFSIPAYDGKDCAYIKVNLDTIKSDIYRVEAIHYESENGEYNANISFNHQSDRVILLPNQKESKGQYTIVYKRRITAINEHMPNMVNIDLPEEIARLIPYFVKSELYEEDEPSVATNALKLFNDGIEKIKKLNIAPPSSVNDIYGVNIW